jgi:hypothetical protein
MRLRVFFLFALVPGVTAAQGFIGQRLPSLDLSPNRWLKKTRPAKPAFSLTASINKTKTPAPELFKPPEVGARPCSVDLRIVPQEDTAKMPPVPLAEGGRTPEVKLPAPPCGTAKAADATK